MADLSTEQRCELAVKLVEQAPPGEVNDVINDIRQIIGDDQALMPLILPSIRAYNLSQLTAVEHPETEGVPAHYSLLSEASIVSGEEPERYVDAVGGRSFVFDHASSAASDYHPYTLPEDEQTFRAELAKSLEAYTKNHFPAGQSSVSCSQYPLLPDEPIQQPDLGAAETGQAEPSVSAPKEKGELDASVVAGPIEGELLETKIPPEHAPAGDIEPVPTPKVGETGEAAATAAVEPPADAVVDQPGGLEKLDEEIAEEKEKEEKAAVDEQKNEPVDAPPKEAAAGDEATTLAAADAVDPPKPARVQQKVENPTYTLEVVGNRYNPSNFWTGRWRTRWIVDQAKGSVDGTILVDVHYYEQGNVQLAARHEASFPVPQASGSQSVASQIVTTISKMEAAYQMELNDAYGDLGDKAFRALRRALPVTRQKMDWDKVSGYLLGSDISKARA